MPLSIWYAAINDALHMHSPPAEVQAVGPRRAWRGRGSHRWRGLDASFDLGDGSGLDACTDLSDLPAIRAAGSRNPAFGAGSERANHVKLAVLIGSLLAATLATVVLRIRNGVYRRIEEAKPPMTTPTACPTSTDLHDPHMAAAMSTF